jgi:glycosyltransferase involved in cell wall biosynthesis
MSGPRLSIILPTRNRAKFFERSLCSALEEVERDFPDSEVIVIDGGSTDGTVDILKRYGHKLAYWSSEPDTGIAEAANKGFRHARGDVIRLIGDDDELLPGKLRDMMDFIDAHPEYDVVGGHNELVNEEANGSCVIVDQGRFVGEISNEDFKKWGKPNYLIPEVCFFRKQAFQRIGGYNLSLKWWGFLDLFFRMINSGMRIYVRPVPILRTYQTVVSDTRSNLQNPRFWKEYVHVIKTNAGLTWAIWHYFGGTLNPARILLIYIRRLLTLLHFHPRKLLIEWWSAMRKNRTGAT